MALTMIPYGLNFSSYYRQCKIFCWSAVLCKKEMEMKTIKTEMLQTNV